MQFAGTVLYVDNIEHVADFYRRAFGLTVRYFDKEFGYAELETGGSTLALATHTCGRTLMADKYPSPANGQTVAVEIAFFTADVAGAFAKSIEEGAIPLAASRRMPWGLEVAYVRAPEGTMIGFSEPSKAPSAP